MNCREIVDFLMDFVEGDLPAEQAAAFKEHLLDCPCCAKYMDCYRKAVELGRTACRECEPVPEDLIKAILNARGRSKGA